MRATLEQLAIDTIFKHEGMTLRKTTTIGPCDPRTMKAGGKSHGCACDIKLGGQFQTSRELQVWLPMTTEVSVD